MAGETQLTLVGNLTNDPELRFTPSGAAVCNFTVASTPRHFDKERNEWVDGDAMFLNCSVWRQAGENVAESLQKGARVIVVGNLKARSYEDKDGNKRTVFEVEVNEVGPSLKTATAKVVKASRQGGSNGSASSSNDPWASSAPASAPAGGADPWATPAPAAAGRNDEPPF